MTEIMTRDVSSGIEIIIKAQTEKEALEAVESYYSRYAYQGYGTNFHDPFLDGDVWVVSGWRARSC